MRTPNTCHITTSLIGLCFGFTLSRIGFSDFERVHQMFTFSSFELTLAFAAAVATGWIGFRYLAPAEGHPPRHIHSGTIVGGVLFGIGWALCGACPSIALVQLGEGKLAAVLTLAGIFVGTRIYAPIHARFFNWPTESCSG